MSYVRLNGSRCVYCGDVATQTDHFPPQCVRPREGWLLPCCSECNVVASNIHPYDFQARVAHVKNTLHDRHWDMLKLYDEVMRQRERVQWEPFASIASHELPRRLTERLNMQEATYEQPRAVPAPVEPTYHTNKHGVTTWTCGCGVKTRMLSPDGITCIDCYDTAEIESRKAKKAKLAQAKADMKKEHPRIRVQTHAYLHPRANLDPSEYILDTMRLEISRHFNVTKNKISKVQREPNGTMWFTYGKEVYTILRVFHFSITIRRNPRMEARPNLVVNQMEPLCQ
jgi:hypothetical protein